jgi:chromosome segregation ATPase
MDDLTKNEMKQEAVQPAEPKGAPVAWSTVILGLGLAASLGLGAWIHSGLVNARLEVKSLQKEVATLRQTVNATDQIVSRRMGETAEALRAELDAARRETSSEAAAAKLAAKKQAELVAARLAKKQEEQGQQLSQQLNEIRTTTEQAAARLTDITSEVGTVKTEVAGTRNELEKTISDLRRVTGDLGVMSGLIATNSKEIQALRELGDRDIYEFTLNRKGQPQRIAGVQMALRKADPKRNRFTLEVVADDKKVEKKDRNINEPMQFYVTSLARQPLELVVNEVKKDVVVGYLAVPKAKLAAARRPS